MEMTRAVDPRRVKTSAAVEAEGEANGDATRFACGFAGWQCDVRAGEDIDGSEEVDAVFGDIGMALGFVPLELE